MNLAATCICNTTGSIYYFHVRCVVMFTNESPFLTNNNNYDNLRIQAISATCRINCAIDAKGNRVGQNANKKLVPATNL